MKVTFRIRRYDPEHRPAPWQQEYAVEVPDGTVVLDALHEIRNRQDSTLAYRFSCRGAICGSCAMRINGAAALACKTQLSAIAKEGDTITLEPLLNMAVIRDLVVDQEPFFKEMRERMPWLLDEHHRKLDEPVQYGREMAAHELDQWNRSGDCIKCQACFSDCPKRLQDAGFVGPEACVDIYRWAMDPRDTAHDQRKADALAPGGVRACDKHGNCVKVCPKDVRPMRAIMFLRKRYGVEG